MDERRVATLTCLTGGVGPPAFARSIALRFRRGSMEGGRGGAEGGRGGASTEPLDVTDFWESVRPTEDKRRVGVAETEGRRVGPVVLDPEVGRVMSEALGRDPARAEPGRDDVEFAREVRPEGAPVTLGELGERTIGKSREKVKQGNLHA